jgi:phage shock protein A
MTTMGIFKRIRDFSLATLNTALDKVEDPIKMLSQYIRDMESDIVDAEQSVSKQIAMTQRFKNQLQEAQAVVDKRQNQAEQALKSGNEELAREALNDKKKYDGQVKDFTELYETNHTTSEALKEQLREMKHNYEEVKSKKQTLEARAESAKAQKNMSQAMSGFGKDNAVKGFERMENKILQYEAEAVAANELSGSAEKSLDQKFEDLEPSNGVDDELAALKKKLGV